MIGHQVHSNEFSDLAKYGQSDCGFFHLETKHVVAITSEEEKKNCCVDGPIVALLIFADVSMWEHRAFHCQIFRCGKVY
jgi:hypothetical protein